MGFCNKKFNKVVCLWLCNIFVVVIGDGVGVVIDVGEFVKWCIEW